MSHTYEWISVKDELPEETRNFGGSGMSDDVLVYNTNDEYEITYYFYPWRNMKLEGFSNHRESDEPRVLFWSPLPEAPKLDEKR